MEGFEYFEDRNVDENERRNTALQVVSSLREAINLGRREANPITYEKTLDILSEVNPILYTPITKLLKNKNESETVKFYKQLSESQSDSADAKSPLDLINEELKKLEFVSKANPDKFFIKRRVLDLKAAQDFFAVRRISEHKALNQDFYLTDRSGFFGEKIYTNDSFIDYSLNNDRILRLRLLHPDNEEAILGCDLIYEQFDLVNEKVRFVHMQYKMWENNTLYFSDDRMMKQFDKLEANLCNANYCEGAKGSSNYRLPFCSAFLRPTSKMQNEDSKLSTTGLHIPLCQVRHIQQSEKKLTRNNSFEKAVSNKIFEELFHSNMIGSRWIPIDELDQFYNDKGIKTLSNLIRVHAQEVKKATQEEIDLKNLPI